MVFVRVPIGLFFLSFFIPILSFSFDKTVESNMGQGIGQASTPTILVAEFQQEVSRFYTMDDGLPSNVIHAVAITEDGIVYAGTDNGLAQLQEGNWRRVDYDPDSACTVVKHHDGKLYTIINSNLRVIDGSIKTLVPIPQGLEIHDLEIKHDEIYLATTEGLYIIENGVLRRDEQLSSLLDLRMKINDVAIHTDHTIAVAAESGLFVKKPFQIWKAEYPSDEERSWAPQNVKAVGFEPNGSLWFAGPQGAGNHEGIRHTNWVLFEGKDGLPYNDFTTLDATNGSVWFGTALGAVRVDHTVPASAYTWHYRQGKRWLPGDYINDISTYDNQTWFATDNGVGVIEQKTMTLAEKAAYYEQQADDYIKRTEYGYLSQVGLKDPDYFSEIMYSDSDNDGLWTAMYGAGECFAYAASNDDKAKQRAKDAFEALRFLSIVTQEGEVEQQPGYVARTVVPITEPDPNNNPSYSMAGQIRNQQNDALWKAYVPRYPLNENEGYWYKTDTSSDELDGHYFFYGLYYDLVADSLEEKQRVRETVQAITDHLIRNDFVMIDHDGEPTRWAIFRPSILNRDFVWYPERGLNSLSMLSYLAVTEHVTGDEKYGSIARQLQEEHHYDINAMIAKVQYGPGSGNQSDDEMALMNYYNLIKYSNDDALRNHIRYSLFNYWAVEFPEMNPFFNFVHAVCCYGESYSDPWGTYDLTPWEGWLEDSLETLKGFSLDRRNWAHQNSHRIDLVPLPRQSIANYPNEEPNRMRAHRYNGKVIPVENRHFSHWNTDPWVLDYGGNGRSLSSGQVFLLPYYMGLYYGFIQE